MEHKDIQNEILSQVGIVAAESGIEFEDMLKEACKDCGISLKSVGIAKKSKKLEEMSKEEIFKLVYSEKPCIFPEQVEILGYIYDEYFKKHDSFGMAANLFFMYGIMLGKSWERRGVKY